MDSIDQAMVEAEINPTMLVNRSEDYDSDEARAAYIAIGRAERTGNAVDAANADRACRVWIDTHKGMAMAVIADRLATRKALAERDARPRTTEEIDKMMSM